MSRNELINIIFRKRSFLCIGLDTDIRKIPPHLMQHDDPVFAFNKAIIDATHDLAIACKPNLAFYESMGARGWESLRKTMDYLKPMRQELFLIADAKRGDIGNTSEMYARAFFDPASSGSDFDAVTVAPYMGEDSVKPFLGFPNKWVILLALTSNKGADDFQLSHLLDPNIPLYEQVIKKSKAWGSEENMMYVVGATRPEMLTGIRHLLPHHFLLVPGIGAQGGSLAQVAKHGMTKECGLIVNASRNILYASSGDDFAEKAREEAKKIQQEMNTLLIKS